MILFFKELQTAAPAANRRNDDAHSFDKAMLKLSERQIVVAQPRPLLVEKHCGWACVVRREVMRHAEQAMFCILMLGNLGAYL